MADKKYLVVHPKQYLETDEGGKVKMRHVPAGTTITLDESKVKKLVEKKRLKLASEAPSAKAPKS